MQYMDQLFEEMESNLRRKRAVLKGVLDHNDNVVRTRAVWILAGIGAENAMNYWPSFKNDKNAL